MIRRHIQAILGADGAVDADARGTPRAAPRTEDECALILMTAAAEGWRVRIEGSGTWIPADAPADLALSTRLLTGVTHVSSADLVATARAGTTWADLRSALAEVGMWAALDPPGCGRSLGSVLATGSAGPLRTGFGSVRNRVLGLTLVTGDGRVVRAGGTVVKNVAGYDLTKLATGSFGAFGIVTSVNLRLCAVPRADVTLVALGDRDNLLHVSQTILAQGTTPAALELLSPRAAESDRWMLAARSLGSEAAVAAEVSAISRASAPVAFRSLAHPEAAGFWTRAASRAVESPTTLRLGTLPATLAEALDIIAHHLDEKCADWVTVSTLAGVVRWSGDSPVERLRLLRRTAAQREMPVTLERAPWPVREALGHYGAYREHVARLVSSLRTAFDRAGVLVVPLGGAS